jgi:hypothetical protein
MPYPHHEISSGGTDMIPWYASAAMLLTAGIIVAMLMRAAGDRKSLASVISSEGAPTYRAHSSLPLNVRRHLAAATGNDKAPSYKGAIVMQQGKIRRGPTDKWMTFTARQGYSSQRPAFTWIARVTKTPLVIRDSYDRFKGSMQVRAGPLVISRKEGREMDIASLQRYASEVVYVPHMMASSAVGWKEDDDAHATMTITDGHLKSTLRCTFGEDGMIKEIWGDRNCAHGGERTRSTGI